MFFEPWNCTLQLDQLPFAKRSPVGGTKEKKDGSFRSPQGIERLNIAELVVEVLGGTDGWGPYEGGSLLLDKEGNLYGGLAFGGAFGWGAVFKVDPTGNETVLYSFTGGTDGAGFDFVSDPIRDNKGNLYGTTDSGGDLSCTNINNGNPGCRHHRGDLWNGAGYR